ncbi:MAG: Iron-sulfur cluster-binding protein [Candidatus Fermentimicrarchaeum limneticum]|uniref:Iron-sulfur cluster-binding protein n=1 Tax=Fermentimicrarchaeum limneticum TaxID=2795018 RepID=A0A7D6BGD5_FERL1|nr:MAG: Iron-sulfur cluster-binding protein [Candidatus Fermentimicrarchaeum limneticum]
MPDVSIVKCPDYSKVKVAVKRSLDLLGGARKFFKKDEMILLKPNISDPLPPDKASNTHPLLVRAVIEVAQRAGAKVWVGECSAGGSPGITKKCLEISGIGDVLRETGVEFKNFQEEVFVPRDIPGFKVLEKTDFAGSFFQADSIVNLPKLKTHGLTFMTGAVKNCFGFINPQERQYLHRNFPERERFSQGLVDVYSFIKPRLTIMDAVVGMEGEQGPSFGDPRRIGAVIAGGDGVAVDAVAAEIIGYNPLAIPMIRSADERGVGSIRGIRVVGSSIDAVKVRDFKKHPLFSNKYRKMQGFGSSFVMMPEVDTSKCTRCRTCADNCPVGAILMDPYPVINRKKCIMCYCCHELCPSGACRLEVKWFGKKDKRGVE